jgi:hypothetical protein
MVVSGTILFVIGERLAEQLSQLSTQVPDAWARAKLMLQQSQVGRSLLDGLASSGSALSSRIGSFASGTLERDDFGRNRTGFHSELFCDS